MSTELVFAMAFGIIIGMQIQNRRLLYRILRELTAMQDVRNR